MNNHVNNRQVKKLPVEKQPEEEAAVLEKEKEVEVVQVEKEPIKIILEELEESEPPAKRPRLNNKLIIDKETKLSRSYITARIENTNVELRCEDSVDDIVEIRVPAVSLFRRPCSAGWRVRNNLAAPLTRLFLRSLGVGTARPLADMEIKEAVADSSRRIRTRTILKRNEEKLVPELQVQAGIPVPDKETSKEQPLEDTDDGRKQINPPKLEMVLPELVVDANQEQISDLQRILDAFCSRKRVSEYEISPKRQRSFRLSQQQALETSTLVTTAAKKENVPGAASIKPAEETVPTPRDSVGRSARLSATRPSDPERRLAAMLQEASLIEIPSSRSAKITMRSAEITSPPEITMQDTRKSRKGDIETSEKLLGSLDRTKVSLGDSDRTTDLKRFISDQWGIEGTMIKILESIKNGVKPLTIKKLISNNPGSVTAGHKSLIAARCFNSILRLKQHGFVVITKDKDTLEIKDIHLGPRFD